MRKSLTNLLSQDTKSNLNAYHYVSEVTYITMVQNLILPFCVSSTSHDQPCCIFDRNFQTVQTVSLDKAAWDLWVRWGPLRHVAGSFEPWWSVHVLLIRHEISPPSPCACRKQVLHWRLPRPDQSSGGYERACLALSHAVLTSHLLPAVFGQRNRPPRRVELGRGVLCRQQPLPSSPAFHCQIIALISGSLRFPWRCIVTGFLHCIRIPA